MAIDFSLTDAQRELQSGARAFADTVLSKVHDTISPISTPEGRFFATKPFYEEMAKAGFVHALIPVEYGGTGMSLIDFGLAAEELARVDLNVPSALLGTGLAIEPILYLGTEEQKRRMLPPFLENPGELLAAFAWTEEAGQANSDSRDAKAGIQTTAELVGDSWVINGEKHYATNGCGWDGKPAHLIQVVCRTDHNKSPQESTAVIMVPGNTPGVEVAGYIDQTGHPAVLSPIIRFTNARVPADNILGTPSDGLRICSRAGNWTAPLISAATVGVMRAAFDYAYEFAMGNKQLGSVPVIAHQNVGYMLADIKIRIEAARYLAWKACHYMQTTDPRSDELAIISKVFCSETCVQVLFDAMRLVGIRSYSDKTPLARLMQDALVFPLYDGGNMGVRRRQLHGMMRNEGYDPLAAAHGEAQLVGLPPA